MVQRLDVQINPSALQRRRSTGGNIQLKINLADDHSVAKSFNNPAHYREADCRSIDEVLKYCRGSPTAAPRMQSPRLGVHALETGGGHLHPGGLHPWGQTVNNMPYLPSPRHMYHSKTEPKELDQRDFAFPHSGPSTRQKTPNRNTKYRPTEERRSSLDHGDMSKAYAVNSVSKSSLKSKRDKSDMFMPTYTVVVLGELSVGKSALCRRFFHSEVNSQQKKKVDRSDSIFGMEDDDYLNSPGTLDSQGRRVDNHHVYERPVTVDGHCVRIRILDINAEKHRSECGDSGDFEPYLEAGDAYALTYSVADRGTFRTVMDILERMCKIYDEQFLPIILVGNKCDLVRRRQVTTASGIKLAAKYGIKFIETSASLSQNVTELFEGVIQQIRLRHSLDSYSSPNVPGTSSKSSSRSTNSSKKTSDKSNAEGPSPVKAKSQPRSVSLHKKRKLKRAFTRRLTEFLGGGGEKDSMAHRAKSCQDLSVL